MDNNNLQIGGQRNSNIELLRFVLMTSICIWHVLVHGLNYKAIGTVVVEHGSINLILMCILVPSVNCFMLISGYYGIRFSGKKMFQFMFQAFFYFAIGTVINYVIWNDFNIRLLKHIFPIMTNQWWFLTCYFILLILSPIINKGIESLQKSQFTLILVYLLLFNSLGPFRNDTGYSLTSILILYLLGRYLKMYSIILSRKIALGLWLVVTVALWTILTIVLDNAPQYAWTLFSYNNPLIVVQGICILYFVLSFPPKHNSLFIIAGAHCFSIYLMTEIVGLNIYSPLAKVFKHSMLICIGVIFLIETMIILFDHLQSIVNKYVGRQLFKILNI